MLRAGDLLPHFTVRALDGDAFTYASIWQRRNLALVLTGDSQALDNHGIRTFSCRRADFEAIDAVLVLTSDHVGGLPRRGFVIADRWGEIIHVAEAADPVSLPSVDDLLDWVSHTQMRCPECEGETK